MKYLKIFVSIALLLYLISGCGSGKKANELNQKTAEELLEIGNSQFNSGQYKEAVNTYELLMDLHPTSDIHIETQLKIAESYGALDKFEDQMNKLLQLLRENIIPERVPQIYVQLGKFYERSAQFNPGVVTSDTADYKIAIDYYNRALKYKDSNDNNSKAEGLFRRALVEAKIGQINAAIEHYRFVTVLFPDNTFSLLAKVKLRNPEDTSELAMDKASIESYQEMLGEGEITQPEEEIIEPKEEQIKEPLVEPEQEETESGTQETGSEEYPEVDDSVLESSSEDTTGNQ